MLDYNYLIAKALKGFVRVNKDNHSVEIFNEYGVHIVLRDLDEDTFKAFEDTYYAY